MKLFAKQSSSGDGRVFRSGVWSAAIAAAVIVLAVLVNLIVRAIPSRYTEFDLSEAGLYTLSESSRQVADDLTQDVTIYYLAQTGNEDQIISKLLDKYAAQSSHITWELKDPAVYPTFAAQYGAQDLTSGGLIGGALIEYFSAMLTDNTIESAKLMADEGDKMLSTPGVLEGKVKPDYNKLIGMAANQALKKMVVPSVLALCIPVIGGFVFGVQFVGGILIGATIVAIPRALFMGNSGGAFDNAKKYIESEALEGHGKGSAAHKAAVTGDTVGDTRKDVVGVALDIFIKSMSTVANTLASLFSTITLIH